MDLADHFERHGNAFTDGQIVETTRRMGTGKNTRERRVVYQYLFKRSQHDWRAINKMIEREEAVAAGTRTMKKDRFVKITDPAEFAEHLRTVFAGLAEAVHTWQREARARRRGGDPVAAVRAAGSRRGRLSKPRLPSRRARRPSSRSRHKAADAVERVLREGRLRPIVDRALAIWAQLKQESNVELVDVKLTGTANRRAVDIRAVVDDVGANALPVMSQGGLNSLALALYLPRATSEDSPFRFLVLDDPVQAMDSTKVEGLAAVLSELAKTRQVIVLSHDDRLAQAARRLRVTPNLLQVRREPSSSVVVQNAGRDTASPCRHEPALRGDVPRCAHPGHNNHREQMTAAQLAP